MEFQIGKKYKFLNFPKDCFIYIGNYKNSESVKWFAFQDSSGNMETTILDTEDYKAIEWIDDLSFRDEIIMFINQKDKFSYELKSKLDFLVRAGCRNKVKEVVARKKIKIAIGDGMNEDTSD